MEDIEVNFDYHIQDEAKKLLKEIELMKKNVENSEMYAGMCYDLERNQTFRQHLARVLGSYTHVQLVIYALGSIEFSYFSMFQLAVILLLKRDFSEWIGHVEVYDPAMSPADVIVLKELGFEVLTINEGCKRKVERPTMFYMPGSSYYLIGNLLGSNWSSSCINQVLLLTNSFRGLLSWITPHDQNTEALQRVERILDFTTEIEIKTIDIKTTYDKMYVNVFSGFSWHFFVVDPNMDMKTSLPVTELLEYETNNTGGCYWLDKQKYLNQLSDDEEYIMVDLESNLSNDGYAQFLREYRGPRHLKCKWIPPPPGWIKLNIYGIGTEGDQPGRYSGIFKDETGIQLGRYRDTIHVEDCVIAGLEALRNGLIRCAEIRPNVQKLIVESDNVILVQYLNGCPEPNRITRYKLKEIFDLMEHITCAVYHVYEEANEAARVWALKR